MPAWILAGLKIIGQVLGLIDRNNDRVAGENKVKAVDNAAAAQVNANVAKAAVQTDDAAALERLLNGGA